MRKSMLTLRRAFTLAALRLPRHKTPIPLVS